MPQQRGDIDKQGEGLMEVPLATMDYTGTEVEIASKQVHEEERHLRAALAGGEHHGSSRPPSPPESRSPTPRVSIAPCPVRLTPLLPPVNYGAVEKHTIFRSGFPQDRNVEFLEELGLNGMISLVEEEMKPEVSEFLQTYAVNHVCVPIKANKEGEIRTTLDSLCEAILFLLNPANHPVYIHCNRGKHRTGCVVACLRKCQSWPIDEVLAEYETYAGDKARPEDKKLIRSFDPAVVFKYAQSESLLESWPGIQRKDSVLTSSPTNVFDLASWIPAHDTALIPIEDDDDDMSDDGGLEIAHRVIKRNLALDVAEEVAKVADVDMLEKEFVEQQDEDAIFVEEVDNIDPRLAAVDTVKDQEGDAATRNAWSDDKPSPETTDKDLFASSKSPPLSVSPVRAKAAA